MPVIKVRLTQPASRSLSVELELQSNPSQIVVVTRAIPERFCGGDSLRMRRYIQCMHLYPFYLCYHRLKAES